MDWLWYKIAYVVIVYICLYSCQYLNLCPFVCISVLYVLYCLSLIALLTWKLE